MAKSDRCVEWAVLGALSMLLGAGSARADQVNVARGMALEGEGFKGQLNVDAGWTTGNTELLQLKAGVSLVYDAAPHSLLLSATGAYAEHERTTIGEQLTTHSHYRYLLCEHFALELYGNYLYDKFAGFDAQLVVGPDIVFLFAIDELRVDVGLGYMLQYEDYGAITGTDLHDLADRAQAYVFIKYALAPNLEFIEHAFYMPRLDSPGPKDYQIISATSLAIRLSPVLSYQNSLNLSYDEPAPFNTSTLNTELLAGLALKF